MDAKKIGQKLRDKRGEKTLWQVAKETGLAQSTLTMYETGRRVPKDDIKVMLAGYYGTTVQDLFFN